MRAPEWRVARRFGAQAPDSLAALRGKVVVAVAFQMLCPGCVAEGVPQARRVRAAFDDRVAVLGLHSVFEHHAAQGTEDALSAFLHEYRIDFPVALDAHAQGDPIPLTMRAYGLRGTPSTLLIDRAGLLRMNAFGHVDDLVLGASIATLMAEAPELSATAADVAAGDCAAGACPAPA